MAKLPDDAPSEALPPPDQEGWISIPVEDAAKLATVRSLLQSSQIPFHVANEFSTKSTPMLLVPQSYASDVEALLAAYSSTR